MCVVCVSAVRLRWEARQLTTEVYVPLQAKPCQQEAPERRPGPPGHWCSPLSDTSSVLLLQLYFRLLQDNLVLKDKLQEMELLLSQNKVELERLRQVGAHT